MQDTSPTFWRRFRNPLRSVGRSGWLFFGLIVAGMVMLPVDVSLSSFCCQDGLPGELRRMIHRSEFFGHAYGILGIAITVYMLDFVQRRKIGRLLACSLGAGLLADIVKCLVHRSRPHDFDFQLGVAETFQGLSVLNAESFGEMIASANHSLPSAHTASAVGLAMALGWMYPHARRWFIIVACLVGIQRVNGGAHFASDVFWGAAVGHLVATHCLGKTRLAKWFDRWELRGVNLPPVVVHGLPRRAA